LSFHRKIGRMESKAEGGTQTLTYNNAAPVHAAKSISGLGDPTYDLNGNMTAHAGDTYDYNADNRLVRRTEGGDTVDYTYDGQGNLVKKTLPDGSWTIYIGDLYEKHSDGSYVKYYWALGRRIAMRVHQPGDPVGEVSYLLADHLGSSTQVLNADGTLVPGQSVKYYPYGSVRAGTMDGTDKKFTGQQEEGTALGLYDYGARFYSTKLGRFLSPDPLVGGSGPLIVNLALSSVQGLNLPAKAGSFAASRAPSNPQSLDRYSYVLNNPLRYTDPTGLLTEVEKFFIHLRTINEHGTDYLKVQTYLTLVHIQLAGAAGEDVTALKNALKGIFAAGYALSLQGTPYASPGGYDLNGDGVVNYQEVNGVWDSHDLHSSQPPDSIDCSGVAVWSYIQVGVELDRSTFDQYGNLGDADELRPGDLIYYYNTKQGPAHVTMYIGEGMMVEIHDYGYTVGAEAVRSSGWVGNRRPRY